MNMSIQKAIAGFVYLVFLAGVGPASAYDPGTAGPLKQSAYTKRQALCEEQGKAPPPDCTLPPLPEKAESSVLSEHHIRRGLHLFDLKRYKQAGREFRQAAALHPESAKAQLMAARYELALLELHFDRKYLKTAEPYLKKAETLASRDPDVMSTRAFVLWYMMRREDALETLGQVLKTYPKAVFARLWRARMHNEDGKYKLALADYDVLIHLFPDNVAWRYSRANILVHLNRNKEAIADLSAYLEKKPYQQMAYISRAVAYHRSGNTEAALADLNAVLDGLADGTKFVLDDGGRSALLMRRAFIHLKLKHFNRSVSDSLSSTSLGGVARILKLKLYLKRQGFNLKIDDKLTRDLEKAIRQCFSKVDCSRTLFKDS